MKVLPFKIPKLANNTIIIQEDKDVAFYEKLHQHKEIQISYIISGKGTFVIGDAIKEFKENDIFIFGSNVPHVLKSDIENSKESYMISAFFTHDSFGQHFFELPELYETKKLIDSANFGIRLLSNQDILKRKFQYIINQKALKRIICFFEILEIISSSTYETISSFTQKKMYTNDEGKRMSDIFEYTLSNFSEDISLAKISNIANMTPNAFCRYFKSRTNKTYFQFLIEVRIGNACKLLKQKNNLSISEISYKCGFKNISNFNRKFKSLKKVSPSIYRKEHLNVSF